MTEDRASISKGTSYTEIGEYWDRHDLDDVWNRTKEVEFDLSPSASKTYFAIERHLSERVRALTRVRGVSAETLLNLWVQERLLREQAG